MTSQVDVEWCQVFCQEKGEAKSIYRPAVKVGAQYQALEQDTCSLLLMLNMLQSQKGAKPSL